MASSFQETTLLLYLAIHFSVHKHPGSAKQTNGDDGFDPTRGTSRKQEKNAGLRGDGKTVSVPKNYYLQI